MGIFKAPDRADTEKFYDDLISGHVSRNLWGAESRFDPTSISQKYSVQKYFVDTIRPYLNKSMKVMDFGGGTGGFSMAMAPLVSEIESVDISSNFVEKGRAAIAMSPHRNINICHIGAKLPYEDATFDAITMVDLVHHLDNVDETMTETMRVLKPGGRLLVFEPNKLNFLLSFMCLLDKNEWGLLRLGTPWIYRKLLGPYITIERLEFNGLLVGPESKGALAIADQLDHGVLSPLFKWLSPKIFLTGIKK